MRLLSAYLRRCLALSCLIYSAFPFGLHKISSRATYTRLLDTDREILSDMQDDFPKRFKVKDFEEEQREIKAKAREQQRNLETKIAEPKAVFGSLSIEDLKSRMQDTEATTGGGKMELKQKLEDLNGIKPERPLQFSVVAAIMAVAGYQFTVYLTGHLAVNLLDSDLYPVQRFAIVARNVVIGVGTLGTTFSAIIALGLVALSARVALGISKGELDPNMTSTEPEAPKDGSIRNVGDLMKQIFDNSEENARNNKMY